MEWRLLIDPLELKKCWEIYWLSVFFDQLSNISFRGVILNRWPFLEFTSEICLTRVCKNRIPVTKKELTPCLNFHTGLSSKSTVWHTQVLFYLNRIINYGVMLFQVSIKTFVTRYASRQFGTNQFLEFSLVLTTTTLNNLKVMRTIKSVFVFVTLCKSNW